MDTLPNIDVQALIKFGDKIYTDWLVFGGNRSIHHHFFDDIFPFSAKIGKLPIQYVGIGRHRVTYLIVGTEIVLKFPLSVDGFFDNTHEAEVKGERYAECCMVGNSTILAMEFVDRIPYESLPGWAGFIDCGQVGKTKDGRIVAYDFGY